MDKDIFMHVRDAAFEFGSLAGRTDGQLPAYAILVAGQMISSAIEEQTIVLREIEFNTRKIGA